jgi:AraC-like DNA-binding protein
VSDVTSRWVRTCRTTQEDDAGEEEEPKQGRQHCEGGSSDEHFHRLGQEGGGQESDGDGAEPGDEQRRQHDQHGEPATDRQSAGQGAEDRRQDQLPQHRCQEREEGTPPGRGPRRPHATGAPTTGGQDRASIGAPPGRRRMARHRPSGRGIVAGTVSGTRTRPQLPDDERPAWDLDRVKDAVAGMLAQRPPDIHLIARQLHLSQRTLQRRLRGAGVTYGGLVAEVRRQAAERLLQDQRRKIADVARALGYSDPAHFTRAFVRWTGISPRGFRGRAGAGDQGRSVSPKLPR